LTRLILFPGYWHWRTLGFATVLFALFLVQRNEAHAALKVCNQSVTLYNVAVGAQVNQTFKTQGWWTLPASTCVTPIKEDLEAEYVYVYAMTATGDSAFEGGSEMCVDTKRFEIEKTQGQPWDCWVHGFQQVKFKEIDTGNASSWTVFIRGTTP
jgi:uncharacterized membrane protein